MNAAFNWTGQYSKTSWHPTYVGELGHVFSGANFCVRRLRGAFAHCYLGAPCTVHCPEAPRSSINSPVTISLNLSKALVAALGIGGVRRLKIEVER
jgi:hypothetical protein